MEPIHEDNKPEPIVQKPTAEVEQKKPEVIQAEGKPSTYQSVGVGRPAKYQSVGVGRASKYQSVGVGRAQKHESLAYQLEYAMGRIPRPDLQAMAKRYANNPLAFVKAVVDYYRKGIVTYKAKTSKLLTDERIIQMYFKVDFGLYVKVNRTGVEFTHDPGNRARPDVQILVDAIRQAKRQASNIVAKARAGNRHSGKKSVNDRAITKHLVTGTYKPKPKAKAKEVAPQVTKKGHRYNWQKTPNNVINPNFDRHHDHYKEPFKSYGMSFSGNGDWPVIHGMDGEVDLMIDLNKIMPAMGATFSETTFSYKVGLKFVQHLEEFTKIYKNLRSVHSKLNQIGANSPNHEQVAAALAGVTQTVSNVVIQFSKRLKEVKTPAQRQELIKSCNSTLQKHGFPEVTHELYEERVAGYDKKNKIVYRVSKKHPGYYIELSQNEADGYDKDNNELTTYFKVGANGQMISAGMLNQQQKK